MLASSMVKLEITVDVVQRHMEAAHWTYRRYDVYSGRCSTFYVQWRIFLYAN